jgi:hypothetical protein
VDVDCCLCRHLVLPQGAPTAASTSRMGRRRRWKTKGLSAPIVSTDADPVTRSIALHGDKVAIAAGRRWRVVDVRWAAPRQQQSALLEHAKNSE